MTNFGRLIGIGRLAVLGFVSFGVASMSFAMLSFTSTPLHAQNAKQLEVAANARLAGLRTRAEAGDTDAMLMLGEHYLGDIPLTAARVNPDPRQALHWLTMAAQHKNAAAACALASYYRNHKDNARAQRFTRQAAKGGDAACMYALGMAQLNGNGTPKNPTEAATWIGKAAKAGLLSARYQEAKLHLSGIGVKRDVAKARAMFLHLARQGVPGAMFYAAALVGRSNPQQTMALTRKAAASGHPTSMYQMGMFYQTGVNVAKDEPEARRWYTRAARAGEPEAMVWLAFMFEHGTGGPQNSYEAARWAIKAFRGNAVQSDTILQRPQNWSAAFWKAMQTQLQQAGVYKGRIDGRFTKATLQAIEAVIKQGA
jgi:TPR repeat protein